MMSIRSLADFNRSSPGGAVNGWHRHRHRPGPELPADTANQGWGLLTGHQRGPRPGHTRGTFSWPRTTVTLYRYLLRTHITPHFRTATISAITLPAVRRWRKKLLDTG